MTQQDLLLMKLHEKVDLDNINILRVIGGWIYTSWHLVGDNLYQMTSVFVPEQKPKKFDNPKGRLTEDELTDK